MTLQTALSLLEMAEIKTPEAQLETARLAHSLLDQATTVAELKLVIELILLKMYERRN